MSASPRPAMLEWALRYMRMGWPVFPCRGKEPLVKNGLLEASLNESTIRGWWQRWPNANIAIRTGVCFFVLDVDVKGGGEESYEYLVNQYGGMPSTAQQITGTGGRHFLFANPDDLDVRNSISKIAPGIDVRGTGGYIIACPSIHPDTAREYCWDGIREIEEEALLPAPAWLIEKIRRIQSGAAPASGTSPKGVPAQISEGSRNDQMFRLACSLRRQGFSEEEILATIRTSNQMRCAPPLEERELQTIAKSSARYAPDAKGNLFDNRLRGRGRRGPHQEQHPPDGDNETELPLTAADVEAGIDAAIEKSDLVAAIRLAPEVARVPRIDRAVIVAKLRKKFGRDFPARDFEAAMRDALGAGPPDAPPPVPPEELPPDTPNLRIQPFTDAGNGERIALLYRGEIRYCVEMKKWLVWDGRRWAVDEMNVMRQKAKRMARMLFLQAADETDRGLSAALEKHARASESYSGISNALAQAATEPGVPVSALELDQQPMLLNCPNGTVDLKTETLLPHNKEYLITKLCPVPFEAAARAPHFMKFIEWAMGANPDAELTQRTLRLVAFLQRALGSSLTGDVADRAMFVCYGEGKNGKSTLLALFRDLLGSDYTAQLNIETVMASKFQDSVARADLADLRGARLAVTSEVDQDHKLNERMIKYLAGGTGALIKSKRLYENPIEFPPTHKLWMDCNFRPKIRGGDKAIWDRIHMIPFESRIAESEKDLSLPEKLRRELQGILAWAVRGCRLWLDQGLGDPPEVSEAGQAWRDHDDPLKEYLEDCCVVGDGLIATVHDVNSSYVWWCQRNNEKYPLGRELFRDRLIAKKFREDRKWIGPEGKKTQHRIWVGFELTAEMSATLRNRGDE